MRRVLPLSLLSHLATFALGVVVAGGTIAHSVASDRANEARFAALDSFAQSLSLISRSHVDVVEERKLLYGAISGMVEQLDAHSAFYTPAQYTRLRQDTQGAFGGVGLTLKAGEADYPVVEAVVPSSPAGRAGVLPGDSLVSVNGHKANEKNSEGETISPTSWHSRLRGAAGTRITLEMLRKGWKSPKTLTLLREQIAVPSVESERYGEILHVRIRRFREATSRDLYELLLRELRVPNTRLILDLRGNPGGLLDRGIEVADHFLEDGVIVSVVSRGRRSAEVARAHRARTFAEVPMVALVDQNTASAAEIVAAALKDAGRARLIGVPTYGKGSVQTFLDLRDGSGLKLTTSRYLTPSGATLEGVGIAPDVEVEAFAPLVVTPTGSGDSQATGEAHAVLAGLTELQREALIDDPQLLKGFQELTN